MLFFVTFDLIQIEIDVIELEGLGIESIDINVHSTVLNEKELRKEVIECESLSIIKSSSVKEFLRFPLETKLLEKLFNGLPIHIERVIPVSPVYP